LNQRINNIIKHKKYYIKQNRFSDSNISDLECIAEISKSDSSKVFLNLDQEALIASKLDLNLNKNIQFDIENVKTIIFIRI
jgi:hypothetical protein